jgi:hypothetical protein
VVPAGNTVTNNATAAASTTGRVMDRLVIVDGWTELRMAIAFR